MEHFPHRAPPYGARLRGRCRGVSRGGGDCCAFWYDLRMTDRAKRFGVPSSKRPNPGVNEDPRRKKQPLTAIAVTAGVTFDKGNKRLPPDVATSTSTPSKKPRPTPKSQGPISSTQAQGKDSSSSRKDVASPAKTLTGPTASRKTVSPEDLQKNEDFRRNFKVPFPPVSLPFPLTEQRYGLFYYFFFTLRILNTCTPLPVSSSARPLPSPPPPPPPSVPLLHHSHP